MAKTWCISTTHPLVTQIAEKYNLNKQQARSILNNTRERDNSLANDDITLNFLENQQAFKDSIAAYVQTAVDTENFLMRDPSKIKKERKTQMELLQAELELDYTDEEVENMMNRLRSLNENIRTGRLTNNRLIKLLEAFPDVRRLEFLGDYISRCFSDTMSIIVEDDNYREECGIQKHLNRIDYFKDPDAVNEAYAMIKDYFTERAEALEKEGKAQLASELRAVLKNFNTVLYMFGGKIFKAEGVEVNMNGAISVSDRDSSSNERNDAEDDDDNAEGDKEEKPTDSFSASDQNKSVTSKIAADIKSLLYRIKETTADGTAYVSDRYGYGMATYINVPLAINKLLSICSKCYTFDQMWEALERNSYDYPWMKILMRAMDTGSQLGVDNESIIPSSKKEQLQTMFFQSMRKQHTALVTTYMSYDYNKDVYFTNRDANVSHKYDAMWRKLKRKFARMSGLPVFRNGMIDFAKYKSLQAELKGTGVTTEMAIAYDEALDAFRKGREQQKKQSYKAALTKLAAAEQHMKHILKDMGIDVSNKVLNDYLSNGNITAQAANESMFGDTFIGDETFALRYWQLNRLKGLTNAVCHEFIRWGEAMESPKLNDTPLINPFGGKNHGGSEYSGIKGIYNKYNTLIAELTKFSPDSFESRAYINGKSYYSWNNPSSILDIVEHLSGENNQAIKDYIKKKYFKDSSWFMLPDAINEYGSIKKENIFYSDWLEELYGGAGRDFAYREKPSFCGKDYNEQSDIAYALSVLNDYFQVDVQHQNLAWYRMLIASDKPRYSSIRFYKYSNFGKSAHDLKESDYHTIIAEKAQNFFAQELRRSIEVVKHAVEGSGVSIDGYDIKENNDTKPILTKISKGEKVTVDDVLKNGRYIFRGSGATFYLNKFIVDEIEAKSDLGKYVVDRIFNYKLHTNDSLLSQEILPIFREGFHKYMKTTRDEFFNYLKSINAFEDRLIKAESKDDINTFHLRWFRGAMAQWHNQDQFFVSTMYSKKEEAQKLAQEDGFDIDKEPEQKPYYCELAQLYEDLEEFTYNNWLAKVNMSEIFDVDLAFYGNTTNFQKRNAQVISSGYTADPDAKIHGKKVSDGKYRTMTLQTTKMLSPSFNNIEQVLRAQMETITDTNQRRQFEAGMNTVLDNLKKIDPTDGQAFTSLTGLRKRLSGQGEWSRSDTEELDKVGYVKDEKGNRTYISTDEAVYWRMKRGYKTEEDRAAMTTDFLHVFAQVQKPFVYSFCNMKRDGRTITVPIQHKNSEYALISFTYFLAAQKPDSQIAALAKFMEETANDDIQTGIDTINFDSAVKIGGNSETVNLEGLNGQQTLEALRKAAYGIKAEVVNGKKQYRSGAVTEYDVTDYKIVQQKNEHFKHSSQPMGSQIKILAVNNVKDDTECTLSSGEKITGKELKRRYFSALNKKLRAEKSSFRRMFGLDRPFKDRMYRLSNLLKEMMSSDQKFTVEMRRALSIVERNNEVQFLMPLDEPGIQSAVESMLLSKQRKIFYKQKTKGGIVVQATSWGASEELAIRFYSSNPEDAKRGGVVPTLREFAAEHNYGKDTEAKYKEYLKAYQGGYAWFEAEIPMPDHVRNMIANSDGTVDKKFFNNDGTWNMEEIKKVVPDSVFDAICYRVPTEAKSSMMVCRITHFSPESSTAAKYPIDITEFTGSDFDIDTDTIELRPEQGSPNEDVDNELFDLQLAALCSSDALQETFRSGSFEDLQDLSYRITLLSSGKYTKEQVDKMSFKEAKAACMDVENLDLMNPMTDIILHNQNTDAKAMIAIAAVGVTSHAFMSLYNDVSEERGITPETNPEAFFRCNFSAGGKGHSCQAFTVINDKDGKSNTTQKYIGNQVALDLLYDMDGKLISSEISKYVGASADAAKDAAEYRLNINKATLPILIFMHRLGISSDVARLFISQPIVRETVMMMRSKSAIYDGGGISSCCNTIAEEICKQNKLTYKNTWKEISEDTSVKLIYSELIDNLQHPEKQSAYDKLRQLRVLQTLAEKSKALRNLDSFNRYNSSNAMKGSSLLDRFVKTCRLNNIMRNLNSESATLQLPQNVEMLDEYKHLGEFGKLCSMFPYIAETVLGEAEVTQNLLIDTMKTYNSVFFDMVHRVYNDSFENDTDIASIKNFYTAWKNYLLFCGQNRIADFSNIDVVRYYTKDFARHYSETLDELERFHPDLYKDIIEGNTFIESIGFTESKQGHDKFDVLSTDITGMSDAVLEQYKRDWESLIQHPETKQLAVDIAIHFLARSAGFARDTPVNVMPLGVKEAIPNYISAFANADKQSMSEYDKLGFIAAYQRNNPDDESAVPHFWFKQNSNRVTIREIKDSPGEYTITLKEGQNGLTKLLSKNATEKGETLPNVPVININDNLFFVNTDEAFEITKDDEGKKYYTITALAVNPLGIPNQLAEYTLLPNSNSVYDETGLKDSEGDAAEQKASVETEPNDAFGDAGNDDGAVIYSTGNKIGTFIENSPYGDTDMESWSTKALHTYSDFNESFSYRESRVYHERARKIAGLLGLNVVGLTRSASGNLLSDQQYRISLTEDFSLANRRGTTEFNAHAQAKKLAALISTIGYQNTTPEIKTYLKDADEANALEYTIKLNKTPDTATIDKLTKSIKGVKIDMSGNELNITQKFESADDVRAELKNTFGFLEYVRSIATQLATQGIAESEAVEVNFMQYSVLNENDKKSIIANLKNGNTKSENLNAENQQLAEGNTGNNNRKEIGLNDIAELAERKLNGEKVDDEVRQTFGEPKTQLESDEISHTSKTLVDETIDAMTDNLYGEISLIGTDNQTNTRSDVQIVDDIIVNTANWIKGGFPKSDLTKMLEKTGLQKESSIDIITLIENKLKELDIC